jgi:hypothetical protein
MCRGNISIYGHSYVFGRNVVPIEGTPPRPRWHNLKEDPPCSFNRHSKALRDEIESHIYIGLLGSGYGPKLTSKPNCTTLAVFIIPKEGIRPGFWVPKCVRQATQARSNGGALRCFGF